MAQHREKQSEWPNEKRTPDADFLTPDGVRKYGRPVAGTLRMGTEPRVGPKGPAVALGREERTDFGMDRVSPPGFDPIGTALRRYGPQIESDLVSRQIRGRRRD